MMPYLPPADDAPQPRTTRPAKIEDEDDTIECPECGASVPEAHEVCAHCGLIFSEVDEGDTEEEDDEEDEEDELPVSLRGEIVGVLTSIGFVTQFVAWAGLTAGTLIYVGLVVNYVVPGPYSGTDSDWSRAGLMAVSGFFFFGAMLGLLQYSWKLKEYVEVGSVASLQLALTARMWFWYLLTWAFAIPMCGFLLLDLMRSNRY